MMCQIKQILLFIFSISLLVFSFESVSSEESYPQRIVSLGPTRTEELYLLGIEDKIVGVTTYCPHLPDTENKEKVGTVVKVNLEKIVSLKPDLVLATSLTDLKAVKKLNNLGIKVVSFSPAKNFSQICEQFLRLGRIVGREKEAAEIVRQVKMKVELTKKRIKELPEQKVFFQIGARPLYTATKDSFINDFIEFAGGKNIAGGLKSGFYSREKVLADNPDVIIITTMGIAGEEEKETWQKFKALKAAENNRIYIVDSNKFCSPTPVSFVEALAEIVEILQPHASYHRIGDNR